MSNINRCCGVHKLQVSGGEKVVPQNQYLLRTDAAINTTQSKMGFGAVVHDWQGNLVAGFSAPAVGNLQPLIAEALSLRASLEWCINIQIPLAVIETDSKMLVDKVHNKKADFSALSDVVEDIRYSLSAFPDVHLWHINRTINCRVHNLARRALGQDEESCWNALVPAL
uniref:RNase H type-1 domain-containing protein n=1 Tax=Cannabis sativa TaxID=3483 RepID=A0A803PL98_CANSA